MAHFCVGTLCATAHLFINNPLGRDSKVIFKGLFNSHPPIEERIERLEKMIPEEKEHEHLFREIEVLVSKSGLGLNSIELVSDSQKEDKQGENQ